MAGKNLRILWRKIVIATAAIRKMTSLRILKTENLTDAKS
jgi:hypothetical protein